MRRRLSRTVKPVVNEKFFTFDCYKDAHSIAFSTVYQLASIQRAPHSSFVPKVRTLVHRAFLTPYSPSHPLLLTSTDVRTPKVSQITSATHRVELAWWFPSTKEQLRITGTAHVLPSPEFSLANCPSNSPSLNGAEPLTDAQKEEIDGAAKDAREEFTKWTKNQDSEKNFDWEAERRKMFESMSEHMRAGWVRPVPGTRLVAKGAEDWPEKLPKLDEVAEGDEHTRELVEKAFRNFALVVIEPSGIDYVELGVVPNRRTFFEPKEGKWMEEAAVP